MLLPTSIINRTLTNGNHRLTEVQTCHAWLLLLTIFRDGHYHLPHPIPPHPTSAKQNRNFFQKWPYLGSFCFRSLLMINKVKNKSGYLCCCLMAGTTPANHEIVGHLLFSLWLWERLLFTLIILIWHFGGSTWYK